MGHNLKVSPGIRGRAFGKVNAGHLELRMGVSGAARSGAPSLLPGKGHRVGWSEGGRGPSHRSGGRASGLLPGARLWVQRGEQSSPWVPRGQ